jgi:hypothetical protein
LTTTGLVHVTTTLLVRWFTAVAAVSLLLPDVVSVVELETEAVFEIDPETGRDATVAVILMVTERPAGMVPRFSGVLQAVAGTQSVAGAL